jgi:hypothetical protein
MAGWTSATMVLSKENKNNPIKNETINNAHYSSEEVVKIFRTLNPVGR